MYFYYSFTNLQIHILSSAVLNNGYVNPLISRPRNDSSSDYIANATHHDIVLYIYS